MNLLIQQIPNYSDWTNIWFNKCKSPQYKYIRHNSDIDKCLSLNHIVKPLQVEILKIN